MPDWATDFGYYINDNGPILDLSSIYDSEIECLMRWREVDHIEDLSIIYTTINAARKTIDDIGDWCLKDSINLLEEVYGVTCLTRFNGSILL